MFKIGDRVRIRKDSEWYGRNERNPSDTLGTILDSNNPNTDYRYNVFWDNDNSGAFRDIDLELVESADTATPLDLPVGIVEFREEFADFLKSLGIYESYCLKVKDFDSNLSSSLMYMIAYEKQGHRVNMWREYCVELKENKRKTIHECYASPDFSKLPVGLHSENPHGNLVKVKVTIEKMKLTAEEKLQAIGLTSEQIEKVREIYD